MANINLFTNDYFVANYHYAPSPKENLSNRKENQALESAKKSGSHQSSNLTEGNLFFLGLFFGAALGSILIFYGMPVFFIPIISGVAAVTAQSAVLFSKLTYKKIASYLIEKRIRRCSKIIR